MYLQLHRRWPLRVLAHSIRRREFFSTQGWQSLHFGVFDSFATARAYSATHGIQARYDLDHNWWLEVQSAIHLHDYPVLYWLNRILARDSRVADLGGSVGVSWYAFRQFLVNHTELRWIVCELPEVVEKGRALARTRGVEDVLSFTESLEELNPCDVLLAAGSLQFIEQPLSELLRRLGTPPRYLLINRVPVHEAHSFVTLQNTGSSIAPCHVFDRKMFCTQLKVLDYELLDEWPCPGRSIHIPLRPDCQAQFRGFCFQQRHSADPGG